MDLGDFITADAVGLNETIEMLDRLENVVEQKTVIKKAVREAIKIAKKYAKSIAPNRTGRFKKAIRSKVWTKPDRGEVGQKLYIYLGKSREDQKGAWYGWIVDSKQQIIKQAHIVKSREMQEKVINEIHGIIQEAIR